MKKDIKQELEAFLQDKKVESKTNDEIVIETKTGLIERIDKKLVLADGRVLLKEQDYQ